MQDPAPPRLAVPGTLDLADPQRYTGRVMLARLLQAAEPGDRIVVLYGAGHASWLRDMVQATPGFRLVEPDDYLAGR